MLLADIGNTHIHIYDGVSVVHLQFGEAIERYAHKKIEYISVDRTKEADIKTKTLWNNIASSIILEGAYETMGVDRRALCLSHQNGLFVDAGSAITVDLVEDGVYRGGFILAGIASMLKAYGEISPLLSTTLNREISINSMPLTTRDGISYGIIAPIKAIVEKHRNDKSVYFTGGDGALLSSFVSGSFYDDTLVFKGVQNALQSIQKKEI